MNCLPVCVVRPQGGGQEAALRGEGRIQGVCAEEGDPWHAAAVCLLRQTHGCCWAAGRECEDSIGFQNVMKLKDTAAALCLWSAHATQLRGQIEVVPSTLRNMQSDCKPQHVVLVRSNWCTHKFRNIMFPSHRSPPYKVRLGFCQEFNGVHTCSKDMWCTFSSNQVQQDSVSRLQDANLYRVAHTPDNSTVRPELSCQGH